MKRPAPLEPLELWARPALPPLEELPLLFTTGYHLPTDRRFLAWPADQDPRAAARPAPRAPRPRYLVPVGVRRLLVRILASEDRELVYERGAGWWVGDEQVGGRWARLAIVLVLLGTDSYSPAGSGLERWHVNEEGRRALEDPAYSPGIMPALRTHARASRRS